MTLTENSVFSSLQFLVFSAFAFGGLLALCVTSLFGLDSEGADSDGDHDMGDSGESGHEIEDHDFHDSHTPSFLSFRSLYAFSLGFGIIGAVLTIQNREPVISATVGIVAGLILALLFWALACFLVSQQSNSSIQTGQLFGARGIVVVEIPPGGKGEVDIMIQGQRIPITAESNERTTLKCGTPIIVAEEFGDKVVVQETR